MTVIKILTVINIININEGKNKKKKISSKPTWNRHRVNMQFQTVFILGRESFVSTSSEQGLNLI